MTTDSIEMTGDRESRAAELAERIRSGGALPEHVAIIMDGNGRWAEARGLPRWLGHREGMKAVRRAVEAGLDLGLRHMTLYAFSQENWDRPTIEVNALMKLLAEFVKIEKKDLQNRGVRTRVFGDLSRLPPAAINSIRDLEDTTAEGTRLDLHIAISYGSRAEIVEAARRLAVDVSQGRLDADGITGKDLADRLYTAEWPDPDLLIRTSGEFRISNFLLWQIAYAEIHVTPVLWPDFDRLSLFEAVADFQSRDRRFGRVDA